MRITILPVELVKVEQPEEYEKESWQLSEEEMRFTVPMLREEGNQVFKSKDYARASKIYAKAIGMLEQLMLK